MNAITIAVLTFSTVLFVISCGVLYAASRRYLKANDINHSTLMQAREIESWKRMMRGVEVIDPRTYSHHMGLDFLSTVPAPSEDAQQAYIQRGTVHTDERGKVVKMQAACTCLPNSPDFQCVVHFPVHYA